MEVREIRYGSPEHELEIRLRSKVLREPLGLSFSEAELGAEKKDIHIGAFSGNTLVGCLVLHPLTEKLIKMRQVAVEPSAQGSGIGKQMVTFCENLALRRGFEAIDLHARETAVPFYLRLGYELYGEPFEEVTLPHRKMRKSFKPSTRF